MRDEIKLIFLIVCISLASTFGESMIKLSYTEKDKKIKIKAFILGISSFILISSLLLLSFKYKTVGMINVLWAAFAIIFTYVAGMIIWKEDVDNFDILATICVIAGTYFILIK
jgi:multidrug transporter EmrE-like cation transporter